MLIRIDADKLSRAEYALRQSSEIISDQIQRLNTLEDKIYEAWYSPELTYDYISEIESLHDELENLRKATDEEAGACTDLISRTRAMEAAARIGGGAGF